jgi:hypothetical protein
VDAAVTGPSPEEVRAEARRVVRHLQRYTPEQRADRTASHRLGHLQRRSIGEYFYTHPDVPGVAFPRRHLAARAALQGWGQS